MPASSSGGSKPPDRIRIKRRGHPVRNWLLAGAVLTGLGVAAGYAALAGLDSAGPLEAATELVVPHGSTADVAAALQRAGVVRDLWPFRAAVWLTAWQGSLHAAELAFPAHASLWQVLQLLRNGRPVQHLLTIPEGLTVARLGEVLARARGLTGPIALPDEGAVLPESYAYAFGADTRALMTRAEHDMASLVSRSWRGRADGLPLSSPREMVVLASLVERETHLGAERPLVARVFLNRLLHGMRLQSDPTVIYAESGGVGELDHGLTRGALLRLSPYNTYTLSGLPAGPICAPGRAAIEAVAHPARSDALYFVADGSGGHAFADSLGEHVRNVERYRRLTEQGKQSFFEKKDQKTFAR